MAGELFRFGMTSSLCLTSDRLALSRSMVINVTRPTNAMRVERRSSNTMVATV
jgi:hypothetical protein